jgi:hypothetical protein
MHYSVHHKKITLQKLLKKLVTCRFGMKVSKNICWPYQKSYQIRELVGNFLCSVHARQFRKYWPVLVSVQKLRKLAHQGVIFWQIWRNYKHRWPMCIGWR